MKVGEVIDGKYELIRLLGRGGMGSVWEGRHVEIGRRAALKVLNPDVAGNADLASRFVREAQAAAAIGSDHIVEVYDVGRLPDGSPYLVMELLAGEPLSDTLEREKRLEPERAAGIALQLCEALEPAHARGIVHRDLKPANLFLTTLAGHQGWLKVLDFGIAKVRGAGPGQAAAHLTRTGMTLGTPYYMAPEQFLGTKDVDGRADVYSAGVILYEMLTGETPYTGATYEDLIVQVAVGRARPPAALRPELDPALSDVVLRAIAREAGARYLNMEALAAALRPFAAPTSSVSLPSTVALEPKAAPTTPAAAREGGAAVPATTAAPRGIVEPPPATAAVSPSPALATRTARMVAPTAAAGPPPTLAVTADTPAGWETHPAKATSLRALLWLLVAATLGVVVASGVAGVVYVGRRGAPRADLTTIEPSPVPSGGVSSGSPPALGADLAQPVTTPSAPLNPWVRVEAAPAGTVLGLPAEMSRSDALGFRASRGISAPTYAYEIQQHEVTWAELEPWLERNPWPPVPRPESVPEADRGRNPATGVPWTVARDYCRSLGASLPTEEEWEHAARGRERRPYPWGADPIDVERTHVYRAGRPLSPVMTNAQDAAPAASGGAIYDLLGNAQEWTADLWREDAPGQDESWVQAGDMSFRAVRGLPPSDPRPAELPFVGAAHRVSLCATGACPAETDHVVSRVGFRCSRRVGLNDPSR